MPQSSPPLYTRSWPSVSGTPPFAVMRDDTRRIGSAVSGLSGTWTLTDRVLVNLGTSHGEYTGFWTYSAGWLCTAHAELGNYVILPSEACVAGAGLRFGAGCVIVTDRGIHSIREDDRNLLFVKLLYAVLLLVQRTNHFNHRSKKVYVISGRARSLAALHSEGCPRARHRGLCTRWMGRGPGKPWLCRPVHPRACLRPWRGRQLSRCVCAASRPRQRH